MKVFYDGLGCIFTAHDLRLLDDNNSYELRIFLNANTTKQCDVFLLPENVEKRFDVIGNAVVEYLCFDDDSDRKMYLVFDYQSLSKIEIFKTDKSNTFPYNPYQGKSAGENELTLLIDDGNSKTEPKPKKESTLKTENLLKVITCMAIDKYGYDPKASRNSATGLNKDGIVSTLEKYGVGIGDETIKGYLKDGAKLIDGKKLPELG
jgi:hypothetical protein